MASVTIGTRKEKEGFEKYVGYFLGRPVAINPDIDDMADLGINLKDEPVYTKEVEDIEKDEDGESISKIIKQATIAIYFKDEKTGNLFNARFFLKDKDRWKKDKSKRQWINSQGSSGWALNKEDLPLFLTSRGQTVRAAKDGEADLYDFITKWLSKGDYSKDFQLIFDWDKLIEGDVQDLRDLMKNDAAVPVVCPATVRVTDDGKEYQQIFNKGILPGWVWKTITAKKVLDSQFQKDALKAVNTFTNATKDERKKLTAPTKLQKAVVEMTDRENGCKDSYYLGLLKTYEAEDNFVSGDEAVVGAEELDSKSEDDLAY